MTYLVIKPTEMLYVDTATEAAEHFRPPWDSANLRNRIAQLSPGDELDVTPDASVIVLTGHNPIYQDN